MMQTLKEQKVLLLNLEGSTSGEIVAEGDTVTISDTSLNATYATLVQGAYTGSTISGLSWSGTAVNDTGGVSFYSYSK